MIAKYWKLVMAACLAAGAFAASAQSADACCLLGGCGLFSMFSPNTCCRPVRCPSPCAANYAAPAVVAPLTAPACNSCSSCSPGSGSFNSFGGTPTFAPSPCGPGGCNTRLPNRTDVLPTVVLRPNFRETGRPFARNRPATPLQTGFFGDYRPPARPRLLNRMPLQSRVNDWQADAVSRMPSVQTSVPAPSRSTLAVQRASLTKSKPLANEVNVGWEAVGR